MVIAQCAQQDDGGRQCRAQQQGQGGGGQAAPPQLSELGEQPHPVDAPAALVVAEKVVDGHPGQGEGQRQKTEQQPIEQVGEGGHQGAGQEHPHHRAVRPHGAVVAVEGPAGREVLAQEEHQSGAGG